MEVNHSFTGYIAKRFDNDFWVVAEQYLNDNQDTLSVKIWYLHRAGEFKISSLMKEELK